MSTDFPFWQMKFASDSISAHAGFGWSKHKSCITIFLPLHLLVGTESEPKAENSTAAIKAKFAFSTAHSACWRTDWPSAASRPPTVVSGLRGLPVYSQCSFPHTAPLRGRHMFFYWGKKKTISWSFVARMIMINQSNGEVIAPEVVNTDGIILSLLIIWPGREPKLYFSPVMCKKTK